MNSNFIKQNNVIINKDISELDKYNEQKRLIKARKESAAENEEIKILLKTIISEIAEIKKILNLGK